MKRIIEIQGTFCPCGAFLDLLAIVYNNKGPRASTYVYMLIATKGQGRPTPGAIDPRLSSSSFGICQKITREERRKNSRVPSKPFNLLCRFDGHKSLIFSYRITRNEFFFHCYFVAWIFDFYFSNLRSSTGIEIFDWFEIISGCFFFVSCSSTFLVTRTRTLHTVLIQITRSVQLLFFSPLIFFVFSFFPHSLDLFYFLLFFVIFSS